jgi:hypothetical protein
MIFDLTGRPKHMNIPSSSIHDQLAACLQERSQLADQLQNEVNQTLASVLLWIQHAKLENNLMEDASLKQAETNLKAAIDRLRTLHYMLSEIN